MRRTLFFCCLAIALLPVPSRSQDHSVYLSPLLSVESFNALSLGSGLSVGGSVSFDFTDPLRASCAVLFGTRTAAFDLIGTTGHLDVHTVTYAGSVSYRFLGTREGGELAAALGGGAVVSSVDAMTVRAGGLGSITIPARKESHGVLLAGLSGAWPLSSRLALTCEPAVRFVTPFASGQADYVIAGGLRVALF
jgi:hypothetical protein